MVEIIITGKGGVLATWLEKAFPNAKALSRKELDITNQEQVNEVLLKEKPEIVINAAAYTNVEQAEIEKEKAMQANATGVGNLARACQKINAT